MKSITRRTFVGTSAAALLAGAGVGMPSLRAAAADKVLLRLSSPATPTDQRAVALIEVFAPAVADFATFEPHWNATLFKQGTELEAIARGNLEMSITSPQELATIYPAWSIFTAGYLHRDAEHQKKVFAASFMDEMKKQVETDLGVKLLTVMYLGRRQLDLEDRKEDHDAGGSRGREAAHARNRRLAVSGQGARRQPGADRIHRDLHGPPDRCD